MIRLSRLRPRSNQSPRGCHSFPTATTNPQILAAYALRSELLMRSVSALSQWSARRSRLTSRLSDEILLPSGPSNSMDLAPGTNLFEGNGANRNPPPTPEGVVLPQVAGHVKVYSPSLPSSAAAALFPASSALSLSRTNGTTRRRTRTTSPAAASVPQPCAHWRSAATSATWAV